MISYARQSLPIIMLDPKGKLSRLEFLFCIVLLILSCFLTYFISKIPPHFLFVTLSFIIGLVNAFSMWMITIKRLRDANLSPWIVLCYIIPITVIPLIIFLLLYEKRS